MVAPYFALYQVTEIQIYQCIYLTISYFMVILSITSIHGGKIMKETVFPDATLLRLPHGYLAQVKETARRQGQTSAEFLRAAVRKALRTAEREAPARQEVKQ